MTHHDPQGVGATTAAPSDNQARPYWRFAVWIAIGALIAAGLVCVIWVLVGDNQNGLIARAFLTVLLLAAFAGAALFDASVSSRREQWYVLASMVGWVLALVAGAIKIWAPMASFDWSDSGFSRFYQLLFIVLIIRLALLHIHLFSRTIARDRTTFTRIVGIATMALVAILAVLLVVPLLFTRANYGDFYWRVVVAVTILAAIGTALVPLVRALNAPRSAPQQNRGVPAQGASYAPPQAPPGYAALPQQYPYQPQPQAWPTYADGVTPLPVMPDGSPDWNAYYTGYPTYAQQPQSPAQQPAGQQQSPAQHAPASAQQHASFGQDLGVFPGPGQDHGQSTPPVPPVPPLPPQQS